MASSPASSISYQFMWGPSPSAMPTTSAAAAASSDTQQHASKIYPNFSPPLIAMVAVIGTAVLIVLYSHIVSHYLRRLRRRYRRYRRRRRLLLSTTSSGDFESPPPNSTSFDPSTDYFFSPYGLDESAIKSLPLSIFTMKSILFRDCAVCLLEFEDGDYLRTLPLCSHAFHVDCIDEWLRSHATCPLCRAGVFCLDPPLFIPMRAARIRPSLDDLIFDPPPDPVTESEITPAVSSPPADRNFLLKRSYSFGFERNLAADRMVMEPSTASPWRYRHGGSFWSKRWPSPFAGSSSASRASRVFSFRSSHRGFAVKSPFVKRRGFFPLSESCPRVAAGPSTRRSRAMTSPSAIFMRSMGVTGFSSSRMRCGDPEALLSPERLDRR